MKRNDIWTRAALRDGLRLVDGRVLRDALGLDSGEGLPSGASLCEGLSLSGTANEKNAGSNITNTIEEIRDMSRMAQKNILKH